MNTIFKEYVQSEFVLGVPIFLGAFLLFQIQPLLSKYLLPWFGGSTGVWTVSMIFFQSALVVGYGYAYASAKYLSLKTQVIFHGILLLVCLFFLPVVINSGWKPGSEDNPEWNIILLLAATISIPYIVLASTSPLLQVWLKRLSLRGTPYKFYALSNAGSLLALVSYPFFFEPLFSMRVQMYWWSFGFILFMFGIGIILALLWRKVPSFASHNLLHASLSDERPSWSKYCLWGVLPFLGVILLLAITNHLTHDVAPIPLLWVLPLAIYLISFIVSFSGEQWYARIPFAISFLIFATALPVFFDLVGTLYFFQIGFFISLLFICCMICHGEVFRLRPPERFLTSFYISIAIGGACGGIFVGIIAPFIFTLYFELYLGIVGILVFLIFLDIKYKFLRKIFYQLSTLKRCTLITLYIVFFTVEILEVTHALYMPRFAARNFYGAIRVFESDKGNSRNRYTLIHGGIKHGSQFRHDDRKNIPTTYYGKEGSLGTFIELLAKKGMLRIGVVGLGTGTVAAFGRAGDVIKFYEINPLVKEVALGYFTYISLNYETPKK